MNPRWNRLWVAGCLVLSGGVQASAFSPSTVTGNLLVGTTMSFESVVTTPLAGATAVDVLFLFDDTGSMGGIIGNAKSGASSIMAGLPGGFRYGVSSFDGDPSEGVAPTQAYARRAALTTDRDAVVAAINGIAASGGGDLPEANLYALQQAATTASWNAGAQRLVVMFGDAPGHVNTVTTAQAAAALQDAGAKLIAFNSQSAGSGIDGRDSSPAEPDTTRQASDIIAVTGGSLVHNFTGLSQAQFVAAVTEQIESGTRDLDLVFSTDFAGSGLSIDVRCIDVLGCDDVTAGASRRFAVDITGLEVGRYDFQLGVRGLADTQAYSITVSAVPEPASASMMLAALGLAALWRRRRAA